MGKGREGGGVLKIAEKSACADSWTGHSFLCGRTPGCVPVIANLSVPTPSLAARPVLYSSPAEAISLLFMCPTLPLVAFSPELTDNRQIPNRTSFPTNRLKPAVRLGVMVHAHSPSTWKEEVGRLSWVHGHSKFYREHKTAWVTGWHLVSKTKLSKIKPSIYSQEMRVFYKC